MVRRNDDADEGKILFFGGTSATTAAAEIIGDGTDAGDFIAEGGL